MKVLKLFFIAALSLYLVGAFVSLEPNVFRWREEGRIVFVWTTLLLTALLGLWETQK